MQGHKKWITGISWEPVHLSAPCRRFVSASKDGDARIWDVSLKKCVMCLSGHTLAITCVKWGGDGVIYTGYYFSLYFLQVSLKFSLDFYLYSLLLFTYSCVPLLDWKYKLMLVKFSFCHFNSCFYLRDFIFSNLTQLILMFTDGCSWTFPLF